MPAPAAAAVTPWFARIGIKYGAQLWAWLGSSFGGGVVTGATVPGLLSWWYGDNEEETPGAWLAAAYGFGVALVAAAVYLLYRGFKAVKR